MEELIFTQEEKDELLALRKEKKVAEMTAFAENQLEKYGAPKDFGEVLVMIVYYSSDILLGVIFYVFSMFVFHRLFRRFSSCK